MPAAAPGGAFFTSAAGTEPPGAWQANWPAPTVPEAGDAGWRRVWAVPRAAAAAAAAAAV